jgi:CHASE2 domain-containing sensor protein
MIKSPEQGFSKKRMLFFLARILIALLIAFGLLQFKLDYLEAVFFDLRVKLRPNLQTSGNIEIILSDADTISEYKKVPGFQEHSELLKILEKNPPRAIVYTRQFAPLKAKESPFSKDDQNAFFSGSEKDQKDFAEIAGHFKNLYVQTDSMERAVEKNKLVLIPPFEKLAVGSGPKTVDRNILARDGVSRRVLLSYQGQELIHPLIASLFNTNLKKSENTQGAFDLFDSKQAYINFRPPNKFATTKLHELLKGKVDASRFKDKLVLIGDDIGASSKDYSATPFDKEENTTVTELHANMFDTLIRNDAPRIAPNWLDYILTFAITLLTLFVTLNLKPLSGLLILLGASFGFSLVSWTAFTGFDLWIHMAHPLVAIFVCYYFFIP